MSDPNGAGADFADFDTYPHRPSAAVQSEQPATPDDFDPVPAGQPLAAGPAPDPAGPGADGGESGRLERPRTGNAHVDEATASLDVLDELATSEHADVFDDVHRRLLGALADLDAS